MRAHRGDTFPAATTIQRLGAKAQVASDLVAHLKGQEEWTGVVAVCELLIKATGRSKRAVASDADHGFVYLIQSGKRYKIGATNDLGTRSKAIGVQMPDPIKTVHFIRTDDPFGIEAYWHNRFKLKRTNGEWYDLAREDVSAFMRRKTM